MKVSRLYARHQKLWPETDDAGEVAAALGRRWVHGLIHLGRFEKSVTDHQERLEAWDPLFGEANTSEEDLRRELGQAFHLLAG
jgi:hypothetical protein